MNFMVLVAWCNFCHKVFGMRKGAGIWVLRAKDLLYKRVKKRI